MRRLIALLAVFIGLLAPLPAPAHDVAASAAPSPSPVADVCPVLVLAVMPVPGRATPATSTYAAFLASPGGAGVASGTLWVNTAAGAFHVPFTRRVAMAPPFTKLADPIAFTLPSGAALQNVFVDSLDDPEPGPCSIFNTWVPGYTAHLLPEIKRGMESTLGHAEAGAAAIPIDDPAAACRSGNFPPRVLIAQTPTSPAIRGIGSGTVRVRIHLAADSSIVSATVSQTNLPAFYNSHAIESARGSVYLTATVRCRPVAQDYIFLVVFQ